MKEQMFKAEMLNEQLRQIEEQLSRTEQQHQDMRNFIADLEKYKELDQGAEILVPIAAGVFTQATFTGKQDLFVNVGNGVVTKKNPEDVQTQVQLQLDALEQYEQELRQKFEETLRQLDTLKETFKE